MAAVVLTAWGVLSAWRHVPEFYDEAFAVDRDAQQRANRSFLRKVARLTSDTHGDDHWQICFTNDEINGWLAVDVPKNYADLLPAEYSEPRVRIDDSRIAIAVRHRMSDNAAGSVVTITASVFTTAPGRLALQLHSLRVGAIPLPLDDIVEAITRAGQRLDCPIAWQQSAGTPVAVVVLPSGGDASSAPIEGWQITDNALIVSGRGNRDDALKRLRTVAERILPAAAQSGAKEKVQR